MYSKFYEQQNEQYRKEQAKKNAEKWAEMLDDNAFGDEVVDEPTYARVDRRPSVEAVKGSSID